MIGFADITGVADINVAAAVAAGGPSHFVGPFPFREPMPPAAICRCNLLFIQRWKCWFVRGKADFPDEMSENAVLSGKKADFTDEVSENAN